MNTFLEYRNLSYLDRNFTNFLDRYRSEINIRQTFIKILILFASREHEASAVALSTWHNRYEILKAGCTVLRDKTADFIDLSNGCRQWISTRNGEF